MQVYITYGEYTDVYKIKKNYADVYVENIIYR